MNIYQESIKFKPFSRGFHLITDKVNYVVKKSKINEGLANVFIKHTSASLTINENFDLSVRNDLEKFLKESIDKKSYYTHTLEGYDDMPAHIKSSLLSVSINIPVTDNSLNLGCWQGIYLGEHRDMAPKREIVITIYGI